MTISEKLEKEPFPPCPVGIERRRFTYIFVMLHPVGVSIAHK
jgi:hypothetical protein